MKEYFCSDAVYNLSNKVFSKCEIKNLQKAFSLFREKLMNLRLGKILRIFADT